MSMDQRAPHRDGEALSAVELRAQCHLFDAKLGKLSISRRSDEFGAIGNLPRLGAQGCPSIFVLLVRCPYTVGQSSVAVVGLIVGLTQRWQRHPSHYCCD